MSDFDIYAFILCLIVFSLLTAAFAFLITYVVKLTIKLMRHGAEDERLKKEYTLSQKRAKSVKALSIIDKVVSAVLFLAVLGAFSFSMCVNIEDDKVTGDFPTIQVVNSGSMSSKYEGNDYLFKHNLNDQIQTFDVIITHKLPAEKDLKLYDIVVYEVDGLLVVHRIVDIEEPNYKHQERYFLLQGDAVHVPDKFPVKYSQMKGIYRGERIPMVGSFIVFMQSPAGILCMLLVIFGFIIMPIIEKKIERERNIRLMAIGFYGTEQTAETPDDEQGETTADEREIKPITLPDKKPKEEPKEEVKEEKADEKPAEDKASDEQTEKPQDNA